ncbi:hypothetical protein E8E11_011242 [Didymella keratinophila]|nr:hypothetical protein E8E11_011242 [Didymella keratinophila]
MKLISALTAVSLLLRASHTLPTNLNTTNTSSLYHRDISANTDAFHTAVCRGMNLSWAMQLPAQDASQFFTPISSPFDGVLRDDLHHWGYTELPVQGYLCDFDLTHHLSVAFRELGVDPRSEMRNGPNKCFPCRASSYGPYSPG